MDPEWALYVREIAGRAGIRTGRALATLLSAYLMEDDFGEKLRLRKDIELMLAPRLAWSLFSEKPVLGAPSREEAAGELVLGRVAQGDRILHPFGLSMEELNQHVLIVARSGHGKTVLIMRILIELMRIGIPWLAFDFKRDCRHLLRLFPEIIVIRWEDLKFNPLAPPPGVPLRRWKQTFADVFSHCFGFFHGSRNFLLEFLDKVYAERGENATLHDLYEAVARAQISTRRKQEYYDVVLNRLYSTTSNLGDTVKCRRGFAIESLLERYVVIELDGLGRDEQNLIIESFLAWIYAYRMAQGHRGRLRHVLVFDEAKRVFDAGKEWRQSTTELGVAPIDVITDEIRDLGEALIVSDQEPSKLTHSIKANTYTKLAGSLGHGVDIGDIAEAMDLSDVERNVIPRLERGEWLVKLSGRYTRPFIMRSENLQLEKDVTDEEVRERFRHFLPELLPDREAKARAKKARPAIPELSGDAENLMLDVCAHPYRSLSGRRKALRISWRRFEAAKQELMEQGLVGEVEVTLGGRRLRFLVPSTKGLEYLRARGADTGLWDFVGRVGFEHRLLQVLTACRLRDAGYDATIEARVNGKRIDVLAEKDGRKLGVEIALNPVISVDALSSAIEELDGLIVACKDAGVLRAIGNRLGSGLPESALRKVRLELVSNYLDSLWRNFRGGDRGDRSFAGEGRDFASFRRRRAGDGLKEAKGG